jgi:hypothetical protein
MLEIRDQGSIAELRRAGNVGGAHVGARSRLTPLAHDILQTSLDVGRGDDVTLEAAMARAPVARGAGWRRLPP